MTQENGKITPLQALMDLRRNGSRFAGDIRRTPSGGIAMSAELYLAINNEIAEMEEEKIYRDRKARSDARLKESYGHPRLGRGRHPTRPQGF